MDPFQDLIGGEENIPLPNADSGILESIFEQERKMCH
jgi:hypothetical protein